MAPIFVADDLNHWQGSCKVPPSEERNLQTFPFVMTQGPMTQGCAGQAWLPSTGPGPFSNRTGGMASLFAALLFEAPLRSTLLRRLSGRRWPHRIAIDVLVRQVPPCVHR